MKKVGTNKEFLHGSLDDRDGNKLYCVIHSYCSSSSRITHILPSVHMEVVHITLHSRLLIVCPVGSLITTFN